CPRRIPERVVHDTEDRHPQARPRVQLDASPGPGNRFVQLAEIEEIDTDAVDGRGVTRLQLHRLSRRLQGLLEASLPAEVRGERLVAFGQGRVVPEGRPAGLDA